MISKFLSALGCIPSYFISMFHLYFYSWRQHKKKHALNSALETNIFYLGKASNFRTMAHCIEIANSGHAEAWSTIFQNRHHESLNCEDCIEFFVPIYCDDSHFQSQYFLNTKTKCYCLSFLLWTLSYYITNVYFKKAKIYNT